VEERKLGLVLVRWRAAAAAFVVIAGVFLSPVAGARAQGPTSTCDVGADLAVLPSPIAPWKGAPLRVMFAAEKPLGGELSLIEPNGTVVAKSADMQGGPPYFWFAEVASPTAGTWHATLALARAPAGCNTVTRDIVVSAEKPAGPHAPEGSVWQIHNTWNRATEDFYSECI
jgi:hypothetical protein